MIRARANRVGASLNSGEGSSGGLSSPETSTDSIHRWRTRRHLRPGTEAAREPHPMYLPGDYAYLADLPTPLLCRVQRRKPCPSRRDDASS